MNSKLNQKNEMTGNEKRKTYIGLTRLMTFLFIITVIMFNSCSSGKETYYINDLDYDETSLAILRGNYSLTCRQDSDASVAIYQPKSSYGWSFTNRFIILPNDDRKITAIRIEAITDLSHDIKDDKDALKDFEWVASLPDYPIDLKDWVRKNYNNDKASIMLDEHTKVILYAPNKDYRRLDIFSLNGDYTESPIKNDSLFMN